MSAPQDHRDTNDAELHCSLPPDARVVMVGLGGVGGALVHALVLFLRSLHAPLRLVLIDGDQYQPPDASRQSFGELGNKAKVKASELISLVEHGEITIVAVDQYLSPENVGQLIREGDTVILCVDNHGTRKLVSDHCGTLSDIALLSGGNDGVNPPRERGTYGNVQIAIRRDGQDLTVPLTKYHPEIANPQEKLPHEKGCAELAPTERQIFVTNFAVASALLNALFAYLSGSLKYQEVKFDILDARMLPQLEITPGDIPPRPC